MIEDTTQTINCKNCVKKLLKDDIRFEILIREGKIITPFIDRNTIIVEEFQHLRCANCNTIIGKKINDNQFELHTNKILFITVTMIDFGQHMN